MKKHKATSSEVFIILFLIVLLFLFMIPFYYLIINSFKSLREISTNTSAMPKKWLWGNYQKAFQAINYPRILWNTLELTIVANIGTVFCASLAGYRIARAQSKFNKIFYILLIASMSVPFQTIMIPMVRIGKWLHLLNNVVGVACVYIGMGVPFSTFMCVGGMKSIPLEIEEAAMIDGCTPEACFWKVTFPLMKSTISTFVVLNTFWYWNDFLIPQLMLQKKNVRTFQVAIKALFGEYIVQWDLILPAMVLCIFPIAMFFILMQKNIVNGIAAGAVKG